MSYHAVPRTSGQSDPGQEGLQKPSSHESTFVIVQQRNVGRHYDDDDDDDNDDDNDDLQLQLHFTKTLL